ncbi:pilus assembly protein PilO [Pseudomonas sp. UL073]|uniref:Pilus assembly protein PilO n=1 Tax=Zestomonas insulae TaxID=2809017 RepID=A0ABS2IBH5_9GAMM|nr:GspMb/PilO family protein [Pseudomonas insulae]MBM7059195.1 pilus assembly protein PilO [Pseudomonas insulae]
MRVPRLVVHEQLRALGRPGAVGAGLLLLAVGYALFGLLPGYHAVQGMNARLASGSAQLAGHASGGAAPVLSDGRQLEDFHRTLPTQQDAAAVIDRIYVLADQEHIALARGEYALGVDPKTHLARYRILLPVSGSYPQLRRFMHGMLEELPALVLEDVDFQRKQVSDVQLQGRIRMTLYLSRR